MKVLILGASGIIGQHMRLCVPEGVEPIWHRREADLLHAGMDLTGVGPWGNWSDLAEAADAAVVINLAGESRPDVVEKAPDNHATVNSEIPWLISGWCRDHGMHYVHVSTQAVLGGGNPPYSANEQPTETPVNEYGHQKLLAEDYIWRLGSGWTIVRPTFVLGIRPMPAHGGRTR